MAKSKKPDSGIDFLLEPDASKVGSLCVVTGDEAFLKHEVLNQLRQSLLGDGDAELAWHTFLGKEAEWVEVADAVMSRSLFGGGQQIALVEEADTFVTRNREQLEKHAETGSGLIMLEVKSMPTNTRIAKRVLEHGKMIRCSVPDRGAELGAFRRSAIRWLQLRANTVHQTKLPNNAAEHLLELLPMQLGLLDQEVARLALLAGDGGITVDVVTKQVGGWRVRTAWEMIDAVVDGNASEAITQLDRLLIAGEQPIGVLAQLGSTLRKFATAANLVEQAETNKQRISLQSALEQAGMPKFKLGESERQLRQIGRIRARELASWVLESDLSLKGHNSTPARARIELERLIVRLSGEATPTTPA